MDGARGRARTAILPRVHLGGEPQIFYYFRVFRGLKMISIFRVHSCPFVVQIFYCFRVFRAFRGLKYFVFSCPLVSISGSKWL